MVRRTLLLLGVCISFNPTLATAQQASTDLASKLAHTPLGIPIGDRLKATELDVAVNVLFTLQMNGELVDQDGDGELTYNDTVIAVNAVLNRSLGDIDADGFVDEFDLDAVDAEIDAGPDADVGADANFDDVVDGEDATLVEDMIGTPTALVVSDEEVASVAALVNYLNDLAVEDVPCSCRD